MHEPHESRRWLAQQQLDALKFSYKDHEDWWRALDAKAQGTVAIGGGLLAGAFAFVNQLAEGSSRALLVLLVITVLALILSIGLAVCALVIVPTATVPDEAQFSEQGRKVLAVMSADDAHERGTNFLLDQAQQWVACIQETAKEGDRKADGIRAAQILVLVAAMTIAVATVMRVLSHWK